MPGSKLLQKSAMNVHFHQFWNGYFEDRNQMSD